MAHTSFFFIAITAGYFITLTLLRDIVQDWETLRHGLIAYGTTFAIVALATIFRSIAIGDGHPKMIAQAEVWISGFSWIAGGICGLFLLRSLLPSPRALRELNKPKSPPSNDFSDVSED